MMFNPCNPCCGPAPRCGCPEPPDDLWFDVEAIPKRAAPSVFDAPYFQNRDVRLWQMEPFLLHRQPPAPGGTLYWYGSAPERAGFPSDPARWHAYFFPGPCRLRLVYLTSGGAGEPAFGYPEGVPTEFTFSGLPDLGYAGGQPPQVANLLARTAVASTCSPYVQRFQFEPGAGASPAAIPGEVYRFALTAAQPRRATAWCPTRPDTIHVTVTGITGPCAASSPANTWVGESYALDWDAGTSRWVSADFTHAAFPGRTVFLKAYPVQNGETTPDTGLTSRGLTAAGNIFARAAGFDEPFGNFGGPDSEGGFGVFGSGTPRRLPWVCSPLLVAGTAGLSGTGTSCAPFTFPTYTIAISE